MKTKHNKASLLLSISALGLILVGCSAKDAAGPDAEASVVSKKEASNAGVNPSTAAAKKSSDSKSATDQSQREALDALKRNLDSIQQENADLKSELASAQAAAHQNGLSEEEKFKIEQETARFNKILEFMMMSKLFGGQAKLMGAIAGEISGDADRASSEEDPCIPSGATADAGYSFNDDIAEAMRLARSSFEGPEAAVTPTDESGSSNPEPAPGETADGGSKFNWIEIMTKFREWAAKQAPQASEVEPSVAAGEQTGGRESTPPETDGSTT